MGVPAVSPRRPSSSSFIDTSASLYPTPTETQAPGAPQPPPNGLLLNGPQPHAFGNVALPRLVWNFHPDVKLKLRKRFYPLGVTRLTLGADFDMRTHDVAFKWSWKDRIIGGRLEFFANQISLTKRFDIDKRSKVDVRAAFDIETRRTLFSLQIKPFPGITAHDRPPSGLTIKQKIPVDRRLAVEVHGRLSVPEARFSNTSTTAVSLGEGDFVFDLDQLNFRLLLQ